MLDKLHKHSGDACWWLYTCPGYISIRVGSTAAMHRIMFAPRGVRKCFYTDLGFPYDCAYIHTVFEYIRALIP